jgi:hypothetical protein
LFSVYVRPSEIVEWWSFGGPVAGGRRGALRKRDHGCAHQLAEGFCDLIGRSLLVELEQLERRSLLDPVQLTRAGVVEIREETTRIVELLADPL